MTYDVGGGDVRTDADGGDDGAKIRRCFAFAPTAQIGLAVVLQRTISQSLTSL